MMVGVVVWRERRGMMRKDGGGSRGCFRLTPSCTLDRLNPSLSHRLSPPQSSPSHIHTIPYRTTPAYINTTVFYHYLGVGAR